MKLSHEQREKERAAVEVEALTWLRTPYHEKAGIKGVGVDCVQIIKKVYVACGVVDIGEIPDYSPQWHLHRNEEMYLDGLLKVMVEVAVPERGDVALFKFARTFSHGSFVVKWPVIVHAYLNRPVEKIDASKDTDLWFISEQTNHGKRRPVRFFTPKRWSV